MKAKTVRCIHEPRVVQCHF